jgi:hypothetical protein
MMCGERSIDHTVAPLIHLSVKDFVHELNRHRPFDDGRRDALDEPDRTSTGATRWGG